MKALKCGTLGASFGKPCASGYVEGILDEYYCAYVYTVRRGNLGCVGTECVLRFLLSVPSRFFQLCGLQLQGPSMPLLSVGFKAQLSAVY